MLSNYISCCENGTFSSGKKCGIFITDPKKKKKNGEYPRSLLGQKFDKETFSLKKLPRSE